MLAAKLSKPITWTAPDPEVGDFLDKLQGNILKYHGRNNVVFLFCHFRDDAKPQARTFMRAQIARVRSAHDQLLATQTKKTTGQADTRPFVSVFLSRRGYDYFGVPASHQPPDARFRGGMASAHLNDPPQSEWDSRLRAPHAMILVAVTGPDQAQTESTDLLNQISAIGNVATGQSGELIGNQFFNAHGEGVENFGYVDGRSQPLVLTEDIPGENGIDKWPGTEFPVNQFVVRDPGVADNHAYGSYFVFRQLEQDVRGFKMREDEINQGHDNGKENDPANDFLNRDSAGVGRLESGTPYELAHQDTGEPNITNNFTYTTEPPQCPHFAHIRKVNPRTPESRAHLMIRRGMTYGTRKDAQPKPGDPSKLVLQDGFTSEQMPSGGVGLLFQSYQADIGRQFETSQGWANSTGAGGLDPVIGQAKDAILPWPLLYGSASTESVNFYRRSPGTGNAAGSGMGPYVKLRGGEYFFAPSLPFLRSL